MKEFPKFNSNGIFISSNKKKPTQLLKCCKHSTAAISKQVIKCCVVRSIMGNNALLCRNTQSLFHVAELVN